MNTKLIERIWMVFGVLYLITFYLAGRILKMFARLLLAIAYFFMLERRMSKDILKNLW